MSGSEIRDSWRMVPAYRCAHAGYESPFSAASGAPRHCHLAQSPLAFGKTVMLH